MLGAVACGGVRWGAVDGAVGGAVGCGGVRWGAVMPCLACVFCIFNIKRCSYSETYLKTA